MSHRNLLTTTFSHIRQLARRRLRTQAYAAPIARLRAARANAVTAENAQSAANARFDAARRAARTRLSERVVCATGSLSHM